MLSARYIYEDNGNLLLLCVWKLEYLLILVDSTVRTAGDH